MPDFTQLLRRPAQEANRPPPIPADDYPGIIKNFEFGDSNTNKTPYVRFFPVLTDWGNSVPETWEVHNPTTNQSYTVGKADIDLSKRQQRRDFFLTPDAVWRLHEFLTSCGIEMEEVDGFIDYNEYIPQAIGKQVLVEVQQYLNTRTNEIGNQIGRLLGQS
jgi:hypothetical protein